MELWVWMQGDFVGLTRKSAEPFRSFLVLRFPRIFEGKPISTLSGVLLPSHHAEMIEGAWVFKSCKCLFPVTSVVVPQEWQCFPHLGKESLDNSNSRQHNSAPASLEIYLKLCLLANLFHSFLYRMCLLHVFIKKYILSIFFMLLFWQHTSQCRTCCCFSFCFLPATALPSVLPQMVQHPQES